MAIELDRLIGNGSADCANVHTPQAEAPVPVMAGSTDMPKHDYIRRLWLVCLSAGLAVLFFGPYLMSVFPGDGAGDQAAYGSPVFAFEFARSEADLLAVFGSAEDPDRQQRIAAMERGTRLDFIFAVLYSVFLASFFVAAHQQSGSRLMLGLAAFCVVAGSADIIENIILLGLTENLQAARNLACLSIPVQTKFLCLVVAGTGAGIALLTNHSLHQNKLLWKLSGGIALVASMAVIPGLADPRHYGFLVGNAITICWLVLLLYAGAQVWSRRK